MRTYGSKCASNKDLKDNDDDDDDKSIDCGDHLIENLQIIARAKTTTTTTMATKTMLLEQSSYLLKGYDLVGMSVLVLRR